MEGGIYLLLGSNLGDRLDHLKEARERLGGVVKSSHVYATAAWGNTEQPEFYNQVIEIKTDLLPGELLEKILRAEKEIGRIRAEKWGPRIIDIDILFYRDLIVKKPDLVIPHPEIQNRRFTLAPLAELTNLTHPVLRKTISQLLEECNDPLQVRRLQH
ncbi:MAG: 2-amino-4-hydroxy-6-hydroxymethyldihydropteridine diphosphokinase [Bacteroidota bacterium]